MTEVTTLKKIEASLFSQPEATVFAILDGAAVPELLQNLNCYDANFVCLYRGELEPDMAEVAPYLVILEKCSPLTEWIFGRGWGKHWGVCGVADADSGSLRNHFRRFLTVYEENGQTLFFRYYDPRVLKIYLPTCTSQELRLFFGPVRAYIVEGENTNIAEKLEIVKTATGYSLSATSCEGKVGRGSDNA